MLCHRYKEFWAIRTKTRPLSALPTADTAMPPIPGCSLLPAPAREKTLFLLGGYTDKSVLAHAPAGGEGAGFYSVMFDPEQAQLSKVSEFLFTGWPQQGIWSVLCLGSGFALVLYR